MKNRLHWVSVVRAKTIRNSLWSKSNPFSVFRPVERAILKIFAVNLARNTQNYKNQAKLFRLVIYIYIYIYIFQKNNNACFLQQTAFESATLNFVTLNHLSSLFLDISKQKYLHLWSFLVVVVPKAEVVCFSEQNSSEFTGRFFFIIQVAVLPLVGGQSGLQPTRNL